LSAQASQRDVTGVRLCGELAGAVRGALGCESDTPTMKVVDTTSDTTQGATPRGCYELDWKRLRNAGNGDDEGAKPTAESAFLCDFCSSS
jgi:hypothetical protein